MRIYITHCSKKRNDSLKDTGKKVPPEKLYTAKMLLRFINKCKEKKSYGRFHPLYQRLLRGTTLRNKVKLFTHIREIE